MSNSDSPASLPTRQTNVDPYQRALQKQAHGLLMEGEEILAIAAETGLSRLWIFPSDGVVVIDERIIFMNRGVFRFSFEDFHWQLLHDIHFSSKFSGATIRVNAVESKSGYASDAVEGKRVESRKSGLVERQAQTVYSVGERMEKQWRERRRERIMEEQQAERGHVVTTAADETVADDGDDDFEQRIEKLKTMREKGLLSDAEFQAKKQEILDSI